VPRLRSRPSFRFAPDSLLERAELEHSVSSTTNGGASTEACLARNRKFDSISLQQRVLCEPDFLDQGAPIGPKMITAAPVVVAWMSVRQRRFRRPTGSMPAAASRIKGREQICSTYSHPRHTPTLPTRAEPVVMRTAGIGARPPSNLQLSCS
jgi:hypothetical protein